MKKHHGMRPHDIVILLKIASKKDHPWLMKDLARELHISPGEISESLERSVFAGLLAADKKHLMKGALLEFLRYGLKYAFPQKPGPLVRGMATAHSADPLNALIQSSEAVVWPWAEGTARGQAVEPLHASAPQACKEDQALYALLALTDALRIGKAREQQLAIDTLKKMLV